MCDKWMMFSGFLEDMGLAPEGMSIDRIDSYGNYTKDNCRWVEWKDQSLNKRKQARNKTGKVGVDFTQAGRYVASIRDMGKKKYLGTFDTLEEAAECRRSAEIIYYGRELQE